MARPGKLLLWDGLVFSVLMCALALVGGALALFFLNSGTAGTYENLRLALTVWVVSFAGTFALSVMFFSIMLRRGELGG